MFVSKERFSIAKTKALQIWLEGHGAMDFQIYVAVFIWMCATHLGQAGKTDYIVGIFSLLSKQYIMEVFAVMTRFWKGVF